MPKIYKMTIDCGRQGSILSTFIATEDEVSGLVGKRFNFYEPFGKYSEVLGEFEKGHFVEISADQAAVELVESLGILPTGHYPFDYLS